ncbi:MAG: hypothetical protein ACE3JP_14210 [Ectobacillus sp.]
MKTRPNLFQYATSELSQDAFVCWLIEWANPIYKEIDEKLHTAGTAFIKKIYNLHSKPFPSSIESLKITRQFQGLDILVEINNEQAILIEDKTYTSDPAKKLSRYYEAVVQKGYSPTQLLPTYYKIGNQSGYAPVIEAKYVPFTRKHILDVLEKAAELGIEDQIFIDYYAHLKSVEKSYADYKALPLQDWQGHMWEGFYEELKRSGIDGDYAYVPNQTGGFFGFWWCWEGNDSCKQYLQLEQDKLCFKIWVAEKEDRSKLRRDWSNRLLEGSKGFGLSLEKPRFGSGMYMTVAVLKNYRMEDEEGKLDVEKTIGVLRKAEELLHKVANTC